MKPVALITGGQQGIGLGIAEALAGAGFVVALASERPADAPAVNRALNRIDGAAYFRHDQQDIAGCADLLTAVEERLGPVTTFVANAGVTARVRGDLLDLAPDSWDFVLGVNLRGAFFLAQEVARRMLAQPSEHYRSLSFVTSMNAEVAAVERGEYCVSKAGASMVARLFAARLAPAGIGVFELRPGIIETAMTARVKERYDTVIAGGAVPAGRWGTPADIGSVMVPLATGAFAFSTGMVIPVDGGLTIPRF